MPHRRQILPLSVRPLAAVLLVLGSTACTRSGEVVVVLDTTMRGEGVEVIAFRSNDGDATRTAARAGSPAGDRGAMTPLDDSAAMLATRFRELRDSLNAEVARLDSMDRRTRAYAVRYAEVRRRTAVAEQLRARRDSVQARAVASRAARPSTSSATATAGGSALPSIDRTPGLEKHRVRDSVVILELAAGRWSIGVVRNGRTLGAPTSLGVVPGQRDTLRLSTGVQRGDVP